MKLLRNPAVTGALVLVAVGIVFYQATQGTRGRLSASTGPAGNARTAVSGFP